MEDIVKKALTIRPLSPGDARSADRIRKAISPDDPNVDFHSYIESQTPGDKNNFSLVALMGDHLVGYLICTVSFNGFGIKNSAWITAIGVDPDGMGQGIGLAVVADIVDIAVDLFGHGTLLFGGAGNLHVHVIDRRHGVVDGLQ